MLFESLKQSYIFFGTIYFGIIAGIFRDLTIFILKLLKNNKVIKIILDLIFSLIFSFLFIICLNVVNFGEFRIYLLLSYILGFILERKTLGFLVDFIFEKIYNFIVKIIKKLSNLKFFKRMLGNDRKTSKNITKNR